MLGQHPQLFDLLETQLFEVDTMEEWCRRFGANGHDGDGLRRSIAEIFFGGQTTKTIRFADMWIQKRADWTSAEVVWTVATCLSPLTVIEKTPLEKDDIASSLQRRIDCFPNAKFLHLVRHPYTNSLSLIEHLYAMRRSGRARDLHLRFSRIRDVRCGPYVVDPQFFWHRVHSCIMGFLNDVPPDRQFRVRGEDVLTSSVDCLRQIVQWLDLDPAHENIELMMHPEYSPFSTIGPASAPFGADPTFLRGPTLCSERRQDANLNAHLPWRPDGGTFVDDVRSLATVFGYS